MEQLIDDIYEIIKDYRQDENMMSKDRIKNWINQFSPDDRVFVLEEMKHILQQRYISKDRAKELVKGMIEFFTGHFQFTSPKDFLLQSSFIDHQPEGKSQKVLLKFLDEIIQSEFAISIAECNPDKPKYYIYFDDILCTGDTLVKGLAKNKDDSKGWFHKTNESGKTNLTIFKENKARLVLAYFCVHKFNVKKALSRLWFELGKVNVETTYAWDEAFNIENDSENANSKLNFLYPSENIKDDYIIECQKQIEEKIQNLGYHKGEHIKFRQADRPTTESFFTSKENRERFEKIILTKSIEVYYSSDKMKAEPRPKPLGYGLYTDMSFGFGTLIFTWRNVPFNVPLVFWYPHHSWKPLFERKFVSYGIKPKVILPDILPTDDGYGESDDLPF